MPAMQIILRTALIGALCLTAVAGAHERHPPADAVSPPLRSNAPIEVGDLDQLPPEVAEALREAIRRGGQQGSTPVILDARQSRALEAFVESAEARAGAGLRKGRVFPADLKALDGRPLPLRGRRTLVNFWATWCAPCLEELPLLEALAAEGTYQVVTLNNDFHREDLDTWLATRPLSLPIHHDAGNAVASEFGVMSWPTSLVLDERGVIVAEFKGAPKSLDGLREQVAAP